MKKQILKWSGYVGMLCLTIGMMFAISYFVNVLAPQIETKWIHDALWLVVGIFGGAYCIISILFIAGSVLTVVLDILETIYD